MNQYEAIFEAPAAHEAQIYGNPEDESNGEFEWEVQEASHYSPEANPYSNPEDEVGGILGNALGTVGSAIGLGEDEWEVPEASYYSPETLGEDEWEIPEASYYNQEANPYGNAEDEFGISPELGEYEWEVSGEADPFFGGALKAIRGIASKIAPLARSIAPKAISALAGMIPGVGPLLGRLAGTLLREASQEAASLEATLFSPEAMEAEFEHAEAAHEAALTELLAAEAAAASNEAEAEAILAGTLPITITIMGGQRALRPVMPALTQANARLVRVIRRQTPAGRQLLRIIPSIQRRAISVMRAAARRGIPINGALATGAMTVASRSLLSNPRHVRMLLERNVVLRRRVAPPSVRRAAIYMPIRHTLRNPRRASAGRLVR
jgi:hypothetical protein